MTLISPFSKKEQVNINSDTVDCLLNILNEEKKLSTSEVNQLRDESCYLPLVALAHQFWLVGAMVDQLKIKGAWEKLPQQLDEYLHTIFAAYEARGQAIKDEIAKLCEALLFENINVMLFKGSASILNGTYSSAGQRYMADIDILVPHHQQTKAYGVLKDLGYRSSADEFDILPVEHHHFPPLIREGSVCIIELHRLLLKNAYTDLLSPDEAWQQSISLQLDDNMQVWQLSPSHQLIQSIAHSELSDRYFEKNTFELRQLHNIYKIVSHYHQQICWQVVQEHFLRIEQEVVLNNVLYRLYQLFGLSTPITMKDDESFKLRLNESKNKFIKKQTNESSFDAMMDILKGYQAQTILALYGKNRTFPLLTGRYLHLKRHLTMVFKKLFPNG